MSAEVIMTPDEQIMSGATVPTLVATIEANEGIETRFPGTELAEESRSIRVTAARELASRELALVAELVRAGCWAELAEALDAFEAGEDVTAILKSREVTTWKRQQSGWKRQSGRARYGSPTAK